MRLKPDAIKDCFKDEALKHLNSLLRVAMYLFGDESTANDLIQETYLRAYRQTGSLECMADCRVWLFKTMTGLINEHQLARSEITEPLPDPEIETNDLRPFPAFEKAMSQDICNDIDNEMIKSAIWDLPLELRYVVVLSFLEGFSHKEIVSISDLDIGTVKSKLLAGRQLLQEILWNRMVKEGLLKQYPAYC